jgi:hypothetical protein
MVIREIESNHLKETFTVILNRTNKKIPAVTKVDECTREETGVGAAIAAGSHDEKGTCALLVIKVITITVDNNTVYSFREKKSQDRLQVKRLMDSKKKTSPTRLTKKVIIPAVELENLI